MTLLRFQPDIDVESIPKNGTWFQRISNGTVEINTGPNGLQKLDLVLKHAQRLGLYVVLSLTNNWNPREKFDGVAKSIRESLNPNMFVLYSPYHTRGP